MKLHFRDRDVGSADLAGRSAEPQPRHVADRRLFAPAGVRDPEADIDRRAAPRACRAAVIVVHHAAVRARVRRRRVAGHPVPYSEPWWTYMDWMPTRPGPVISARYMPRRIRPVLMSIWTVFIVTEASLYSQPPGSIRIFSPGWSVFWNTFP